LSKLWNKGGSIVDQLDYIGGGCIAIGTGLLFVPEPYSKVFSAALVIGGGILWIDSWRWDHWRDILEELEDAID